MIFIKYQIISNFISSIKSYSPLYMNQKHQLKYGNQSKMSFRLFEIRLHFKWTGFMNMFIRMFTNMFVNMFTNMPIKLVFNMFNFSCR